jgi:hypothetical protein
VPREGAPTRSPVALVGEQAQALQAARVEEHAVGGIVHPDHADDGVVAVTERQEEPVPAPGVRPAPFSCEL